MKSHLWKMVSFICVVLFAFSSLIFFGWLFHPKLDRGFFFSIPLCSYILKSCQNVCFRINVITIVLQWMSIGTIATMDSDNMHWVFQSTKVFNDLLFFLYLRENVWSYLGHSKLNDCMIINGINVSKSDKTQNFEVINFFFLKGLFLLSNVHHLFSKLEKILILMIVEALKIGWNSVHHKNWGPITLEC